MDTRMPIDIVAAVAAELTPVQKEQLTSTPNVPLPVSLFSLQRPAPGDPSELIGDRFLCRGGSMLLVSQTGVGKSSYSTQLAINAALGREYLGLNFLRPMKTLIVQAENDAGDMAEFRDGVVAGIELTKKEQQTAAENVVTLHLNDHTGQTFINALDYVLTESTPDLLILDPAFSFIGGDANEQVFVSSFLRQGLNPLLTRHNIGLILIHHTNKPAKEKPDYLSGDYAYLGSGSAEFANWARAVINLRPTALPGLHILHAPKRGKRLGWKDGAGISTLQRYISHDGRPGVICWREATDGEIAQLHASDDPPTPIDVATSLRSLGGTAKKADLIALLNKEHPVSRSTVNRRVDATIKAGLIAIKGHLVKLTEHGEQLQAMEA